MGRVFKIRTEKIFASFRFFFTQFAILQYFTSQNHAKFQNFFIANLAVFSKFFMVKHAKHARHAKHAIVNRREKFYNVL